MLLRLQYQSLILSFLVWLMVCPTTFGQEKKTLPKPVEFKPDQSKLPVKAPKGATVLFDGTGKHEFLSMSGKQIDWSIKDGILISNSGNRRSNHIVSKFHFRDAIIHVEFMLPEKNSGNSGIYIHGNYELQIFNSVGKKNPSNHDIGAIYEFHKPLVNACRKPGVWQVYDIMYIAPRRNAQQEIVQQGAITAWLNGKKVQDHSRFGEPRSVYHPFRYKTTPYLQKIWKTQKKTMTGPFFLQDHNNPVKFRNVWVIPQDDKSYFYKPNEK